MTTRSGSWYALLSLLVHDLTDMSYRSCYEIAQGHAPDRPDKEGGNTSVNRNELLIVVIGRTARRCRVLRHASKGFPSPLS